MFSGPAGWLFDSFLIMSGMNTQIASSNRVRMTDWNSSPAGLVSASRRRYSAWIAALDLRATRCPSSPPRFALHEACAGRRFSNVVAPPCDTGIT